MAEVKRVTARVQGHVDKLREAGLDTQMFFDALVGIRDDTALSKDQRDALYKLVAMENFVWYLEALRGKPVDRIKLAEQAAKVAEDNAVAIKKRSSGDAAAALIASDLDPEPRPGPGAPPDDAPTKVERPPRRGPPGANAPKPPAPGGAAPRAKPRATPRGGPTRVDRPPPKKK